MSCVLGYLPAQAGGRLRAHWRVRTGWRVPRSLLAVATAQHTQLRTLPRVHAMCYSEGLQAKAPASGVPARRLYGGSWTRLTGVCPSRRVPQPPSPASLFPALLAYPAQNGAHQLQGILWPYSIHHISALPPHSSARSSSGKAR